VQAKYLAPDEGQIVQLLGEPRVFKLTPAENGGAYLQFESAHAPGLKVPPHLHREEDEAFYVLAGQYEFTLGETRLTAAAGSFAFAPRNTVHAFTNIGPETGRMLITVTPGTGHEGLFREVEALTRQLGKQPDTQQLLALAQKYGWVMVNPNR
jgi:quercetin dioxygenase-like cupin family protein